MTDFPSRRPNRMPSAPVSNHMHSLYRTIPAPRLVALSRRVARHSLAAVDHVEESLGEARSVVEQSQQRIAASRALLQRFDAANRRKR